jgi:uncharacterized membrane protein YecN with MAPEG domain
MVQIVPLYAGLLGLLFCALSVRTLRLRRTMRVAVGDGGNIVMLRAMRVHANFAEYVPLCLVLLYLLETQGTGPLFLHILGSGLLMGRLSHAYGVSREPENYRFRVLGMTLTLGVLIAASVRLLVLAARGS